LLCGVGPLERLNRFVEVMSVCAGLAETLITGAYDPSLGSGEPELERYIDAALIQLAARSS